MNKFAAAIYSILLLASLFTNKYVLSVLGFQFPMVFQGWQTLVGWIVLRILTMVPSRSNPTLSVVSLDRPGFISLLPNFLLFTVSIIAGSKALSHMPLLVVVSVSNLVPAGIYLLDNTMPKKSSVLQMVSSVVVIVTGIVMLIASPDDKPESLLRSLMDSSKFWLVIHAFCSLAVVLHGRIADARFGAADRLFYSYVFSLIVLAPASLYLEEAFEALNFQERRQISFIIGCLVSAIVGASVNLYAIRLKEDEEFGKLHHISLAIVGLLSTAVFTNALPWWGYLAALLNLGALILVPTHMKKDDNNLNSTSSLNSSQEVLPTRVV